MTPQLKYACIIIIAQLGLLLTVGSAADPERKPNVILMMADDLGYGDLSCYGSTKLKTPVLDRMAAEGLRFTDYYSGNTVCTPSRMALLTGAYPPRLGWQGGVGGYGVSTKNGLAPEALTIAEVFKKSGYATAICGKWHVGDLPEYLPMNQGFDFAYYIKKSNNQTTKLWRNETLEADPFDNRRLSESFSREAIGFIETHKSEPFFLYLPFTAPHFPAQAHPDWKGHSTLEDYGDVVEELDARVGEILAALKRLGLDDNTLVVFTSDNGTEKGQRKWGSAKPFRGLKWTTLEGGSRVPCIIRWPGVVPTGEIHDQLSTAVDLLPTLCAAARIELNAFPADSPKRDGIDLWASWLGNADKHPRTEMLYWNGWGTLQAIRAGNWKLYVDKVPEIVGSDKGPVLVRIDNDPSELTNLASAHPEKVAELLSSAKKQVTEIHKNALPLGGPPPQKRRAGPLGAWLK